MTAHDMDGPAKRLIFCKKYMITVIIALLLISSAVTLSPFPNSSATKILSPSRPLPGQEQEQQQSNQGEEEDEDKGKGKAKGKNKDNDEQLQTLREQPSVKDTPIATSGNYVYLAWPSNKTTADFEIMFRSSTDGGKTFGNKIDLSNSTGIDSERPEISAAGSNVYVSWWERANQTSNEPVLRVSNDNGKSFGEIIKLSGNSTTNP
jgi:hypothetical protein